ncbi:MAG: hypothetical protein NTW28_14015 [Candidatus Solibacter sp.]|nr:hypothetical protein [Candidatus Solibacter sp.]
MRIVDFHSQFTPTPRLRRAGIYSRTPHMAAVNCSGATGLASIAFARNSFAAFKKSPPRAPDIAMIFSQN